MQVRERRAERQIEKETKRKADKLYDTHRQKKEKEKKKSDRNKEKHVQNTETDKTDRKKVTERNDAKAIFFVPLTPQSN